jgi:hypothetical protein
MDNNEVREIFKQSKLSYNDMYDNISILKREIQKELDSSVKEYDSLPMTISKKVVVSFIVNTRNIECFFLEVDGPYFKNRECISFNRDGFIGFAGWASTCNTQPILKGFLNTIDILQKKT